MTLIGWLQHHDDVHVARAAAQAGIDVLPLSMFAAERRLRPGLLLGYSGVGEHDLRTGVTSLARLLQSMERGPAVPSERPAS